MPASKRPRSAATRPAKPTYAQLEKRLRDAERRNAQLEEDVIALNAHLEDAESIAVSEPIALNSVTELRWCMERGYRERGYLTKEMARRAAFLGKLDVLKYARENGCPWDEQTPANAAYSGHLDVLKYAHENGCPWNKYTCSSAAVGGHLAVLKYAHENGCRWDEWTCKYAAYGGHMNVLKYLHKKGCPWSEWTCSNAAWGG